MTTPAALGAEDDGLEALAGPGYEWVRELAARMAGMSCTPADVMRLALDELRDRHPSPARLDAALRTYMWRVRAERPLRVARPARARVTPARAQPARPAPPAPIRVVLAHAHPTVRAGLAGVLAAEDGVRVVAELDDAVAAAREARRARPAVALIDAALPGADAVAGDGVNVVVLAAPADRERVRAVIEAGAVGFLPADAGRDELVGSVRAAAEGASAGGLRAALTLLGPARAAGPALTAREREVLALVGKGLANKQIALRLGITEKTVKTHLGHAFQRIGVADRTQAALWAERNGLR